MQEIEQPAPASAEPVSVIFLSPLGTTEEVIKTWRETLDSLNRPYEIISAFIPYEGSILEPITLGEQLRAGIAKAQFPLIFCTTCDSQFQPADVKRMLEEIDREVETNTGKAKADLVTGYRVSGPVPGWLALMDVVRRVAMRVVFGMSVPQRDSWLGWRGWTTRWIARWIFGVAVQDPSCPFRLFRRDLFRRIAIQSNSEFAHVEVLAKANFLGALIAEIPVTWIPSKHAAALSVHRQKGEVFRLFTKPDFGPTWVAEPDAPARA